MTYEYRKKRLAALAVEWQNKLSRQQAKVEDVDFEAIARDASLIVGVPCVAFPKGYPLVKIEIYEIPTVGATMRERR
ncbi:MAG TPA: hypothetical protein VN894_09540 [Polyangiaceae bacterium]|nr:hypothetical protein [Polyangiaceae bacterium]